MKTSLVNILLAQISRTINSAINDGVIPEIQNAMGTLSSGQRDTESVSSKNIQDDRNETTTFKAKITKKDSRSVFDLRDTEDVSPDRVAGVNNTQRSIPVFLTGRIHSRPNLEIQESAHNVSMNTTLPISETAMPKTSQNLLSNGLDKNIAAQSTYCKAKNYFWKNCPKVKKKRKMENKSGKKPQRPTYPECPTCSKTNNSAEQCQKGTDSHVPRGKNQEASPNINGKQPSSTSGHIISQKPDSKN